MDANGYSAAELLCALGILGTIGGIAVPQLLVSADDVRAAGAARYVAGQFQRARMEAAARSAEIGRAHV